MPNTDKNEYIKKYPMNFWERWELNRIHYSSAYGWHFDRYEKYRLYMEINDCIAGIRTYFRVIAKCGWNGPWGRETVIYGPLRSLLVTEQQETQEDRQWRFLNAYRLAVLDMQAFIHNDTKR